MLIYTYMYVPQTNPIGPPCDLLQKITLTPRARARARARNRTIFEHEYEEGRSRNSPTA
jgi:hypothetical protein